MSGFDISNKHPDYFAFGKKYAVRIETLDFLEIA